MPAEAIAGLRNAPTWPLFEAVAPTLAYDDAVLGDGTGPPERPARIAVPAMVIDGGASPEVLCRAAKAVAGALAGAQYRTLEDQTHDVAATAVGPRAHRVLRDWAR
jgi:hypothetical protein